MIFLLCVVLLCLTIESSRQQHVIPDDDGSEFHAACRHLQGRHGVGLGDAAVTVYVPRVNCGERHGNVPSDRACPCRRHLSLKFFISGGLGYQGAGSGVCGMLHDEVFSVFVTDGVHKPRLWDISHDSVGRTLIHLMKGFSGFLFSRIRHVDLAEIRIIPSSLNQGSEAPV